MRKKALCYLAVTLNAITMKKALFISLCALLLAGTGCKKNALGDVYIDGGLR